MRARWLLLMTSVFCLTVLAPASAMCQGAAVNAGCGTATVDAVLSPGEWQDAAQVALTPRLGPGNREVEGRVLLMNDDAHFYVAAEVFLEAGTALDPSH